METRGFSGGKWVELPPDNERPIAEGGAYEVEAHRGRVGLTLRDSTYECAFVRLTPDEARELARRLVSHAGAAAGHQEA